ncbi:hypothetical protein Agub_g2087 [Astrephomene gubernaculifera]|uniref:Cysteine dioxygenase n=1 Tax=Astrephomene gubernaculifera TaxID=47775 RepID=A0AAD3HIB9_9CHLO|nr:hypothetical protein Agub_g2087 [Astrephomene gubernaculifera]
MLSSCSWTPPNALNENNIFSENDLTDSDHSSGDLFSITGFNSWPRDLCTLVTELTLAFKAELAAGNVLNNRQDPQSFNRLNARVHSLLQAYSQGNCGDWRRYAAWSEHGYLRHLLWTAEEFELMVLCWKGDQTSRVHNHADSHCWLAVLDGEVCETQYQPLAPDAQLRAVPHGSFLTRNSEGGAVVRLVPTSSTLMQAGDVGYINDRIALHSVGGCKYGKGARGSGGNGRAAAESGGDVDEPALSCTLHLYCPPIRRVRTFEAGKVCEYTPGFSSRNCLAEPEEWYMYEI